MRVIKKLASEGFQPKVIFDVGANTGTTAVLFRKSFPNVKIYCFEPVSSTFRILQRRVGADPLTEMHRAALSRSNGVATMRAVPGGLANRIMRHKGKAIETEAVAVHTGDNFCKDRGIARIDFLKIDTEGSDLDVLAGFQRMLFEKRIEYIQVECGISHQNLAHVPLEAFNTFMSVMGYGMIGLFDGVTGRGRRGLWYCNAVFVAEATRTFTPAFNNAAAKEPKVDDIDAA